MKKYELKAISAGAIVLVCVVILTGFSNCTTAPPSKKPEQVYKEDVPGGEIYYTQLQSAPFPHPQRRDGYTREGVFYPYNPHYSNSAVGVFVPKGFSGNRRLLKTKPRRVSGNCGVKYSLCGVPTTITVCSLRRTSFEGSWLPAGC